MFQREACVMKPPSAECSLISSNCGVQTYSGQNLSMLQLHSRQLGLRLGMNVAQQFITLLTQVPGRREECSRKTLVCLRPTCMLNTLQKSGSSLTAASAFNLWGWMHIQILANVHIQEEFWLMNGTSQGEQQHSLYNHQGQNRISANA